MTYLIKLTSKRNNGNIWWLTGLIDATTNWNRSQTCAIKYNSKRDVRRAMNKLLSIAHAEGWMYRWTFESYKIND